MSRPPSYPKDAAIGGGESPENSSDDLAGAEKAADPSKRKKQLVTGAAIGIGSAAIVAALLYANRSRKNER